MISFFASFVAFLSRVKFQLGWELRWHLVGRWGTAVGCKEATIECGCTKSFISSTFRHSSQKKTAFFFFFTKVWQTTTSLSEEKSQNKWANMDKTVWGKFGFSNSRTKWVWTTSENTFQHRKCCSCALYIVKHWTKQASAHSYGTIFVSAKVTNSPKHKTRTLTIFLPNKMLFLVPSVLGRVCKHSDCKHLSKH